MNRLRKRQFRFSAFYLLAALSALYIFQVLIATPQTRKVSYTDFIAEVRAGHLAEVNITSTELIGLLKEDAAKQKQARVISARSEEHTSELQSRGHLVCRLLLEKK